MNHTRKIYISFYNRYLGEFETRMVKNRDISGIKNIPENAFSFIFFDILSIIVNEDGKDIELKSERINVSGKYYINGKVRAIEELKQFTEFETLVSNLNNYKKAVLCRDDGWSPFEEGDSVVNI